MQDAPKWLAIALIAEVAAATVLAVVVVCRTGPAALSPRRGVGHLRPGAGVGPATPPSRRTVHGWHRTGGHRRRRRRPRRSRRAAVP
jgi:hypothetical protein